MAKNSPAKPSKTNAARQLDRAGVIYTLVPFEIGAEHLSADQVARQLGESIDTVFKTLVLRGDRSGVIVCVLPGDREVDLKKTAQASSNKRVELLPLKELSETTGYVRGGCSPIGMKKHFPVYLHISAMDFDQILVSAGMRGLDVKLAPKDLVRVTGAVVTDLCL